MRVPAVVAALSDELVRALGERVVGVYLGGSYAMGDFVGASSDYDVLVVTEGVLTRQEFEKLERLHERLLEDFGTEAQRLEVGYAPRALLVPTGTTQPVPGFEYG